MIIVITPNAFADHIHWANERIKIILYDDSYKKTFIELKKSKLFDEQTAKEILLLETPSKIDYICPAAYSQINKIIPLDQMKSFSEIQLQFNLNQPVSKEIKNTSSTSEITFLHYEPATDKSGPFAKVGEQQRPVGPRSLFESRAAALGIMNSSSIMNDLRSGV